MGLSHASLNFANSPMAASSLHRAAARLFDLQFLGHIIEVDGEDAADATLLHGDAVQHVGLLHSATAV